MDLRLYLFKNKISVTEFAKRLHIHRLTIHHVEKGKHFFSKKLASRIEEITGGAVTAKELRKNVPPRKRRTLRTNDTSKSTRGARGPIKAARHK